MSVAQRQSLLVRNYFQFFVQQSFSNLNLRHILDYKSVSVLIKSNIVSIPPTYSRDDAQLQVDIDASILFEEAQYFATTYPQTLGRIPFIFREKVATLQIRPGE